jgi:hypothetical protein
MANLETTKTKRRFWLLGSIRVNEFYSFAKLYRKENAMAVDLKDLEKRREERRRREEEETWPPEVLLALLIKYCLFILFFLVAFLSIVPDALMILRAQ